MLYFRCVGGVGSPRRRFRETISAHRSEISQNTGMEAITNPDSPRGKGSAHPHAQKKHVSFSEETYKMVRI